jgi:carnosine N-methyltransferase
MEFSADSESAAEHQHHSHEHEHSHHHSGGGGGACAGHGHGHGDHSHAHGHSGSEGQGQGEVEAGGMDYGGGGGGMDEASERKERRHFQSVCRTLLLYSDFAEMDVARRQEHLNRLPPALARRLPTSTWKKIANTYEAIAENQDFFSCVVDFQDYGFEPRDPAVPLAFELSTEPISVTQMHRNQAILHSLAREWSSEGERERELCFAPLLRELQRVLPVTDDTVYQYKVLVPGSGLSRLPVEIASLGYATQANEYSMFMLTASHFLLNGIFEDRAFQVFPWLDR